MILTIPCIKLSDFPILLSYFLGSSPTGFAICVIILINNGIFDQFIYLMETQKLQGTLTCMLMPFKKKCFFFPFCDYR